jgi:hypothetical protein
VAFWGTGNCRLLGLRLTKGLPRDDADGGMLLGLPCRPAGMVKTDSESVDRFVNCRSRRFNRIASRITGSAYPSRAGNSAQNAAMNSAHAVRLTGAMAFLKSGRSRSAISFSSASLSGNNDG